MSSSSPPVDYQKPVKVKSRWTQSCQIEMMMEESQSSLDMSDTVTDVSSSDLNDSTDYNSEFNSLELKKSRRITSNRTNFRQSTKKKKKTSSNNFNEKGHKKKQFSYTSKGHKKKQFSYASDNDQEDICKYNIRRHTSVDWNTISIFQSKSVNNMSEIIDKLPSKPIRRASLPWKFKFSFTKDMKDNIKLLEKDDYYNLSNAIEYLHLNKILLSEDTKLAQNENTTDKNTSQQSYCLNDCNLNCRDFNGLRNKLLNISEVNKISAENLNMHKQSGDSNIDGNQYNERYQNSNLVIPESFLSELGNLKFNPIYKLREIRSKSCDSILKKTHHSFKRYKSLDSLNNLKDFVIDSFKLQKPEKKSPKKKRRQSKRIKPKNNYIEILDDMKVPEVNYNQVADEIYKEHKNQLLEARNNDIEFDEKLKATNFTLVDENVYRPSRQALKSYPPSEIPMLRKLKQRVISGDINDYCECTLSKEDIIEGNTGCDDRCLNRLLKVECGLGCSLKRYCTNKQFQNKQFKKTNIIKTDNKGYGICAVEDIPKGVLISEYVGEVIDYNEMCNRLTKKEYKNLNYMVQLNPDEIIDSTSKGNVTRFINHSCDPNSVGEKWHVLGQSRIGFFSTRHIKKGEEITFDYSFQIFGDGAQICYCGSSKCRGYINKSSQITDHNSSEDSESANENVFIPKPEEKIKKKRNLEKRAAYNDENKLRELGRQLTEIAKLKTGLKADQEMATLNLNRLMVHITDSVSRLHVLTFIREHDMNKRLFMDFSGLSIIHNWMTSNENESFKLMILEILAELPITNRNTITKSKVLDVVAEWAKIPQDIKTKIESLEYPASEIKNHCQEISSLLPNNDEIKNSLVEKSRALWKKWIVLKMVFKIPKKVDQHKQTGDINSSKFVDNCYQSPMDTTLDRKTFRYSNKYVNKVRNQQTLSSDRIKLRKEYQFKVDQEHQKMFRKKVVDDWYEKVEGVIKQKSNENYLHHHHSINFINCNNSPLNNNNGISEKTRWDSTSEAIHVDQNSIINYNMPNPCLSYMPPQAVQQPFIQFPQYSYTQSQVFSDYHVVNQPTYYYTPPPLTSSQPLKTQLQNQIVSNNKTIYQNIESPDLSPTNNLLKLAETNVFNLINNSLRKHYNPDKMKTVDIEMKHSKKLCTRSVQSGADLLARIKVISNSFKNQPSKLITVKNLKQKNNTKLEKVPSSDIKLKSVCDKNKRIVFINEESGVTSNTLSEDLMPTPKTIQISKDNKFANAIFNSLLKKVLRTENENLVPKKFISKNLNSNIITYRETEKEIELYKNMKPKILKKIVGHIKTKNGFVAVIKRQWGIKLKGLKKNCDEIPATKRNLMRKGSIHRLALKNCLVNKTKSALKRQSSMNVDDYLKRPKEKKVTFWIEGETSPNLPHSEVRPINLKQNIMKQKPLMKCHPFKIRNEPKSIFQPSTSAIEGDDNSPGLDTTNDQIIRPIVAKFKASRNKRISLRDKTSELERLRSQRSHKIPISMMSLSVDVLKLIPDNRKEMKKVIDYYHSMATVIVKTLGSYAKKTCQQGRIRNDEDFKYLAKKINENVLLKELQLKKVDKLKISDSTKDKVAEYIRKYMSRFGEVYKRKPTEQTNHHKPK